LITGCSQNGKNELAKEKEPMRVGWISDLSGSVSKWGADKAVQIAVDEINEAGGINGRKFELIMEDGKCRSKDAVNAMNKLIHVDGVHFVLGGHCSPESLAIAPIAQENKVLMFAQMTTSPDLSDAGDYVFRTSQVNTEQSKLIADLMLQKLGIKSLGIIYEETGYAEPIARVLKEQFEQNGGSVLLYEGYSQGEKDFRSSLTKVLAKKPDALFFSPQDNENAGLLLQQIHELGGKEHIFGNEIFGSEDLVKNMGVYMDGIIYSTPDYNPLGEKEKTFIEKYKQKYNVEGLPFGLYTAEVYDATNILAQAISKYGDNVDKVKDALYKVQDYYGASGKFSINEKGDGVRNYVLKRVQNGKVLNLE